VNHSLPRVRAGAIRTLANLLDLASPVQRIELVCQWVLSANASERAAIGAALCSGVRVLAIDFAIDLLAHDPEPEVRLIAGLAAAQRLPEAPDAYERILETLTADTDHQVKSVAQWLLRSLAASGSVHDGR
jgi:hypothetical protein